MVSTGEVETLSMDKDILLRRLKFKVKSLELNIENSEIRLIELDRDKQKVASGIDGMKNQIKEVTSEIRSIEEGEKDGNDRRKGSGEKSG